MPVNTPIINRLASYTVTPYTSEAVTKGVLGETFGAPVSKSLAIFPVSNQDIIGDPNGIYTKEDIKIYEAGTGSIKLKSTISYLSKTYTFMSISDREKDGDFTIYIAKKKQDENQ